MQVVWGAELNDETKGQDVLGVRGLDQRLEASLVNGITTISLRGRYLTILPWLLGEFFDREVAMGATEFSFDRFFSFIARVEYLTLASTHLDPEGGDGGGALGANIFNAEMAELRAGVTVPFPVDRNGTMLGIYVGPCRAMGILANSDGTSDQPVVLTPRGIAIWEARNAAMEGSNVCMSRSNVLSKKRIASLSILWEAEKPRHEVRAVRPGILRTGKASRPRPRSAGKMLECERMASADRRQVWRASEGRWCRPLEEPHPQRDASPP